MRSFPEKDALWEKAERQKRTVCLMKKENLHARIEESIARGRPVALLRKKLDAPPLYCVPLAQSDALLLAALYTDFLPGGFVVVRQRDITGARSGARAEFHARILEREVAWPTPDTPSVPLDGFSALLSGLQARHEPVIIEGKSDDYLLGGIEKVGKNKLSVRRIGMDGRIDGQASRIDLADITSVSFGGRYLRLVARHASPPPSTGKERGEKEAPPIQNTAPPTQKTSASEAGVAKQKNAARNPGTVHPKAGPTVRRKPGPKPKARG